MSTSRSSHPALATPAHLRPHSQALALEPRILFDGAGAAALEHHTNPAQTDHADGAPRPASPVEAPAHAAKTSESAHNQDAPQGERERAERPAASVKTTLDATANAAPTLSVSASGAEVPLGGAFSFTVTLGNTSAQPGYAPFIDLFIPSAGKDGNDGVQFSSATYLGHTLTAHVVQFDASGHATHPLAKDSDGQPLVLTEAAGLGLHNQLVVLELPYASVSRDQPGIPVIVNATLSPLADTADSNPAADLMIHARSGFQYGNDALDNPTADPSLLSPDAVSFIVHPRLFTLAQKLDMIEMETATGPNFIHTETVTLTPATGQTLHDITLNQDLPGTIRVTAIHPGAGGTLSSVTLQNDTVITNAALIAEKLAAGNAFLKSYSITYASVSAPQASTVDFYVPKLDATGQPILDARRGDPLSITLGAAHATGRWTPQDPRDVTPPATDIAISGDGTTKDTTFIAKAITLEKSVTLKNDTGGPGLTPGDTLGYTLNLALSDYFAFGQTLGGNGSLTIADQISDGQTFNGPATLEVKINGVTHSIALLTATQLNADGTTSLTFDIVQSLLHSTLASSTLAGDLAFDTTLSAATQAAIRYTTRVNETYADHRYAHGDLNEGDTVGNRAVVTADILLDHANQGDAAPSDGSATLSRIDTRNVEITLDQVNGAPPPVNGELHPGDVVTFRLDYTLVTGDYESFALKAWLPLPLFDTSSIAWREGSGANHWQLGPRNTHTGNHPSVSNGPGNSVVFSFGNYSMASGTDNQIEVLFTLSVGGQPYADHRSISVLGQSSQVTTIDHTSLLSSDIAAIQSIAEPVLSLRHGVVATSHGTVSGLSGSGVTWHAPGTSGRPFDGVLTSLDAIHGNVSGIDGNDTVRLATAIKNSGGGGAFEVATTITLPPYLTFAGGSLANARVQVYRGDGSALAANVDYVIEGSSIRFLDAGHTASLGAGRSGSDADLRGSNLVLITYDVIVNPYIEAARTLQSSATLTHYASLAGGPGFTPNAPTDATSTALEQVASPAVHIVFADGSLSESDSSATHTHGANLVPGESMLYDIVVALPEYITDNLRVNALIPPGLTLDMSYGNGNGCELLYMRDGSAALDADLNPNSYVHCDLPVITQDGAYWRFNFALTAADNITNNNSMVLRIRLILADVGSNQAGTSLATHASLTFSDPDGDTPNGSTPLERTLPDTSAPPTVVVREPTLTLKQSAEVIHNTGPLLAAAGNQGSGGADGGDLVTYTIRIGNGNAASDTNAYDLTFSDTLPTVLAGYTLDSVTLDGGASMSPNAFVLTDNQLSSAANAKIDLPTGANIVLRVTGRTTDNAASLAGFENVPRVQWTSIDGPNANERTGADGLLHSGVVNDYRLEAPLRVSVSQGVQISRVGGLPDTPAPSPTTTLDENVAPGEIIRYRVNGILAEGETDHFTMRVTLPNGLAFIDDGSVRLALISNGGLSSSYSDLVTSGDPNLHLSGNQTSPEALPLTPDLSGAAPQGVFNRSHLTVTTDAQGNQVLVFDLGDMRNTELDADLEGVSLEFSARTLNQDSNTNGAMLTVKAADYSGSTLLARGNTLLEHIVEPGFSGMVKQITSFAPVADSANAGIGTAQVLVRFTQNGSMPAFDTTLTDHFAGGTNYRFDHLVLDGATYRAADLAILGATLDTTTGLALTLPRIAPGVTVGVYYAVDVPNTHAIAPDNATLRWRSLPDNFTQWGGSAVGMAGTSNGARTGEGSPPNTYVLTSAAGLGMISGTLWDDTLSANASRMPDGVGLGGQTVTLVWAGLDGNLATSADNLSFNTTTDNAGRYHFGVLAPGQYRITAPNSAAHIAERDLVVRIDSDGATLGEVDIVLNNGASAVANIGYVERNQAPVNHLPGTQYGLEDTPLSLNGLSLSDIDARPDDQLTVTLSVTKGTLYLARAVPQVTLTNPGMHSATLQMRGTLASLNDALRELTYQGRRNFNGTDTLTMVSNDNGSFGDANGNGIPGEPGDALSATGSVQIVLQQVNDPPKGVDDQAIALEAGGTGNTLAGINPTGNVLDNDRDADLNPDNNAVPDRLHMLSVTADSGPAQGAEISVAANGKTLIAGLYGDLSIDATGQYQYLVHNDDAAVQALRLDTQTLSERFTYRFADQAGSASGATLTVTLKGANDTPQALADTGTAIEAGGVHNSSAGQDASGNVLDNDSDVDGGPGRNVAHPANHVDYGEVLTVNGIRTAGALASTAFDNVAPGTDSTNGTVIQGQYGTLTLGANGDYRYVVDNTAPEVERLTSQDTLTDVFSYEMNDAGNLQGVAELRITIQGSNDNPVASNDYAFATAGAPSLGRDAVNPSGNVILDASPRPGGVPRQGDQGDGSDHDVDRVDNPNSQLVVSGVREGESTAAGSLAAVAAHTQAANGTAIAGLYGTLYLGADGSYRYEVASASAAVQALRPGATATDVFTYQITDTEGLSDQAQLVITVTGVNDAPTVHDLTLGAQEAGGSANNRPGHNPDGNLFDSRRVSDPDGDPLSVSAIRTQAGTTGTVGEALHGQYGELTLNAEGHYHYAVDNDNADVQALREASDTLTERFIYSVTDSAGATSSAMLNVVITGQNDTPVALNDHATAKEAGGVLNQIPGIDPSGNVLANDTDVDRYGESHRVVDVRTGTAPDGGLQGMLGSELRGSYGWLTLELNGDYTYRVNNALRVVQRLRPGESLEEYFTYTQQDAAGASAHAVLKITIEGAWDAPVSRDDQGQATAASLGYAALEATGSVLANDTATDHDDHLTVTGLRAGAKTANGAMHPVAPNTNHETGTTISGQYGTLMLGADGEYLYQVDSSNPVVIALNPDESVFDVFTYQASDEGLLSSTAQLTIRVHGRNDAPLARDDQAMAVEAGGIHNATPGVNPGGNVLANDTDVDHADVLTVRTVRPGTRADETAAANAGHPSPDLATTVGHALRGAYGTLLMQADGTWQYTLDNTLPAVEALRTNDQTLQEVFTYTLSDRWEAPGVAELRITIEGRNDTPLARDDEAEAVEAGGRHNATPGVNPSGNVLDNDSDVDGRAYGETKQVVDFSDSDNHRSVAGNTLTGHYGQLTLNADGRYRYVLDNGNRQVEALLASSAPLAEIFTYRMRDTSGALAQAHLTIHISGQDDAPIAHDDGNQASDQQHAAQARGNVLANDTDVDRGDPLSVIAVNAVSAANAANPAGVTGNAAQSAPRLSMPSTSASRWLAATAR
ncbi:VCBS domain-containing protein [Paraburkholderia hayleyella]|uniref:VCBS domain-containing protein n=1 Tax=Paraburkholderia hayleyella TaxID=2152889 RepID=UPI001291386E|nr:VCBS domain-containing protein [Paraburkholderia hayleyella]